MSARHPLARITGLFLAFLMATAVLAPVATAATPNSARAFGIRATAVASNLAGVPYKWGGTTRRGFDCSGYTRHVYRKLGIDIPRTSQAQFNGARNVGKKVRPGDLVFFYRTTKRTVFHVGIYAGNDRIWHAGQTGSTVKRERIWTTQWVGGRY